MGRGGGVWCLHWGSAFRMAFTSSATAVSANSNCSWGGRGGRDGRREDRGRGEKVLVCVYKCNGSGTRSVIAGWLATAASSSSSISPDPAQNMCDHRREVKVNHSLSFQPTGTTIDPARCVLKWSFWVKLSLNSMFVCVHLFVNPTHSFSLRSTKGADWCLPHGPGVFEFLSSPQASGHRVLSQRKRT